MAANGNFFNTVYPRWRGELCHEKELLQNNRGLSPLARGTHWRTASYPGYIRFIPAGAGNSEKGAHLVTVIAVYPRWRGELSCFNNFSCYIRGLSPLARGTQVYAGPSGAELRFIPAGAGNSGLG